MFSPSDGDIEGIVGKAFAANGGHAPQNHGQFSEQRFAFLFKPGTYTAEIPIGFYTSAYGLGASPHDVIFDSEKGVYCEEGAYPYKVGALDTFWRSAENFRTAAQWSLGGAKGMMWAASQASPLRRIVVEHDLVLYEYQPPGTWAGYASGGFMSNMLVGVNSSLRTQPPNSSLPLDIMLFEAEGNACPNNVSDHTIDAPTVGSDCCGLKPYDCCVRIAGHPKAKAAVHIASNGTCVYKAASSPLLAETGSSTLIPPPPPPPAGSGTVVPGSQQQWLTKNSDMFAWVGGVWNMVFVGAPDAPPSHCSHDGGPPITAVGSAPISSEKPYITIDSEGKYSLVVPDVQTHSSGSNFKGGTVYSFEKVYVTQVTDTAEIINSALSKGLHVVLSPAVYQLDAPLEVKRDGQVLLGLGLATLVSAKANSVIKIADVDGVRIAGILVQAGPVPVGQQPPTLVQVGTGGHPGKASDPTFLHDLFVRVGGPDGGATDPVAADVMVEVRSGHVVGDNLWLWRADHVQGDRPSSRSSNPSRVGMVVTGDDVTMYGLAIEHNLEDQLQWSGENGQTYFFQSELPYGVTQEEYGTPGYAGYRVNSTVTKHTAYGAGVYSFFRDHAVSVTSGIVCPKALEKSFVAPLSVFLNGNGGIEHVINDVGDAVNKGTPQVSYVC